MVEYQFSVIEYWCVSGIVSSREWLASIQETLFIAFIIRINQKFIYLKGDI